MYTKPTAGGPGKPTLRTPMPTLRAVDAAYSYTVQNPRPLGRPGQPRPPAPPPQTFYSDSDRTPYALMLRGATRTNWRPNPSYQTWRDQSSRLDTAKRSAASDKTTADTAYTQAVADLGSTERKAKAHKKRTGFSFGAGGGGRAGVKGGGVGKSVGKRGKGKGKKGKKDKKEESLNKILGKDFLSELNNLKKYK